MPRRLPACEPCRSSKLACDHAEPACSRCQAANQAARCTYRERPFKRRKTGSFDGGLMSGTNGAVVVATATTTATPTTAIPAANGMTGATMSSATATPASTPRLRQHQHRASHSSHHASPREIGSAPAVHKYPNPGYLGKSSHITIFQQLSPSQQQQQHQHHPHEDDGPSARTDEEIIDFANAASGADENSLRHGVELLDEIWECLEVADCRRMIDSWTAAGVTLALAGVFLDACVEGVEWMLKDGDRRRDEGVAVSPGASRDAFWTAKKLFANSSLPLPVRRDSDLDDFTSSFSGENTRWETLGIFLAALSRATSELPTSMPLYSTRQERWSFHKMVTHFSSRCLDLSLSLDCLNDLQLTLQYENYINHTRIYGDESYHSWRRLGDVISSIFALGYHQQTELHAEELPFHLEKLRKGALAWTYSADKNVSIFLGRPPRFHRQYCRLQLPGLVNSSGAHEKASIDRALEWPQQGRYDYIADARWSAMCAVLKEDILGLSQVADQETRERQASRIQALSQEYWHSLPKHFRLEGPLKHCECPFVERDFVVSVKLNHLHVGFLLGLNNSRHPSKPDTDLISYAASMLDLIVEALLLRSCLANSGTSLLWKGGAIPSSKVIRDLSVLVAEIEGGAFIGMEEPNFALLTAATKAIKNMLDRLLSRNWPSQTSGQAGDAENQQSQETSTMPDWMPWMNLDTWDFELDFWNNLYEHPTLADAETNVT